MDEKEVLRDRIHVCLNRMGRYHLCILFFLGIYSFNMGITNTVGVFYTYTPKYFCGVQDQNQVKWNECLGEDSPSTNCTFDPDDPYDSIVTEYHLICSNRYLAALSDTIFFTGVTIGSILFGLLADLIGRRRSLQLTIVGHFSMALCIHFETLTPTIGSFIIFRFFQGAFSQGLQMTSFTTFMEMTPIKYRTLFGCVWEGYWTLGLIYLGSISRINYEWRTLQLYLLIPTAIAVILSFCIPESLHWLWTQNKFRSVIENCSKIAQRNGDKTFAADVQQFQSVKNWEQLEVQCRQREKENGENVSQISIIFRNRILRKHLLITCLLWFTVTICYYAIMFFLPNLAGDRHTNFMSGAGIEMAAFFLIYLAMAKFGRARIIGSAMLINSSLLLSYAVIELVGAKESSSMDIAGMVLLLLAKGLCGGGFCGMLIITGELFPTLCRGSVFGICGFFSRIGSLLAPQLIAVTELINPAFPMFLLGGFLILTGSLLFLLPETLKIQIPNTMQDVADLWGRKDKGGRKVEL